MPTHAPPRILLAEDDDDMRELLSSALRKDGYDVADVRDGGRLLVRIAGAYTAGCACDAYDLLVSDVSMPVCGGLQILEQLRRAQWSTPAILMTGFGDAAIRARAEALGATLFDKPFRLDDLRAAVRNVLGAANGSDGPNVAPSLVRAVHIRRMDEGGRHE